MSKHTVQWPRDVGEVQRADEQGRVSDLPAAPASHEPPKLLLGGSSLPRWLLLEGAERPKVTLGVDDPFHGGRTEGADQFVFQVVHAHVEPERLHTGASEVGTQSGPLEAATEVALL